MKPIRFLSLFTAVLAFAGVAFPQTAVRYDNTTGAITDPVKLPSIKAVVNNSGLAAIAAPGKPVYYTGSSWALAQANASGTARVDGIIESVSGNNVVVVLSGDITLSGLTAGATYFLSSAAAGATVTTAPSSAGTYRVNLFVALSTTKAWVKISPDLISNNLVGDADIDPAIARDAEVTAAVAAEATARDTAIATAGSSKVSTSRQVNGHPLTADVTVTPADLGLSVGSQVQAYSANLTIYAGIAPSANTQTLLGGANYAAWRSSLGLDIGTNVQAYSANLTGWAGKTAPTGTAVGTTDTQTLTNKRITRRVATLTDAATVTPDVDSYDGGILTTLSQTTTIANPTGTPTDQQSYILRIKSTSARNLSFGTQWRGSTDLALPTVTDGGGLTGYYGFVYNAADTKWDLVAKTSGF